LRIVFRHILPQVLPLGFVYLAQDAAFAILTQASLAFLGLADSTAISWGIMLQWVQVTGNVYNALWWMIPPGLMITLLAAAFYFVGYSLEDVTNPQANPRTRIRVPDRPTPRAPDPERVTPRTR
jgi:peptide/nickel transport system permease protein